MPQTFQRIRRFSDKHWRILPGIFLEDFSGHLLRPKWGEKIRRQNPQKDPTAHPQISSVLPRTGPNRCPDPKSRKIPQINQNQVHHIAASRSQWCLHHGLHRSGFSQRERKSQRNASHRKCHFLRCTSHCTNRLIGSHLKPWNRDSHCGLQKHIASQTCIARFGELRPQITFLERNTKDAKDMNFWGNASLFTQNLFTTFVTLNHPLPKQRRGGVPLEFLLKGPQTDLRALGHNCE